MATNKAIKNTNETPGHEHDLGGMLGATVGGVVGGIAAGAAAGAAFGVVGGPVGVVAGAAVGGALGGIAGEDVAREINPTEEEEYWSVNYKSRPYISSGSDYETYRPAYRYGVDSYSRFKGAEFEKIEPQLSRDWNDKRGESTLEWSDAKPAARDAYSKLDNSVDDI